MTELEAIKWLQKRNKNLKMHPTGSNPCYKERHDGEIERNNLCISALQAQHDQKNGGWISVKDRLPEDGAEVIIRHAYHAMIGERGEYEEITVGYLHQPPDRRRKPYFCWVALSDYGDMVRAESICPGSEFVTHWMPLPEPPKENAK